MDEEARGDNARKQPSFGRIREPVLRFTHLMRALEASSRTGYWGIGRTDVPGNLNQTAMRAPSVFNFYRPGYSPAGTPVARAGPCSYNTKEASLQRFLVKRLQAIFAIHKPRLE